MTSRFFTLTRHRFWRLASLLALAVVSPACHKNDVQFYRVAKGDADTTEPQAPAPGDSTDPRIHWVVPTGWKTLPPNTMRVGNFLVASDDGRKVEISVIPFPGPAGTELDNVNRWRRQINLSPITDAEIKSEELTIGGNAAKLYDMTGTEADPSGHKTRVLAASALVNDTSWFFKMSGDENLVAAQRAAFDQFLKSVSFGSAAPVAPITRSAAPTPQTAQPADQGNAVEPQWDVPKDWKPGNPSDARKGSFAFADNSGAADISVTVFPGDVGGTLANVNRWRSQISLQPVEEGQLAGLLAPLDVAGGKAMLVDMTGHSPDTKKSRIIAVSLPRGGNTWFFKMIGDDTTVAGQKTAFLKFVQSTRLPNG